METNFLLKLKYEEELCSKLRNELESANSELESLKDELIQGKLKIKVLYYNTLLLFVNTYRLQNLDQRNQQLTVDYEQQTYSTSKTVESGKQVEEKLRAETIAHENTTRKFEESLREWRSILESLRKADALGLFIILIIIITFVG